MLRELVYILCCLGLGGMWGYRVFKSIKNKSKSDIIYCCGATCIFIYMTILKIVEIIN